MDIGCTGTTLYLTYLHVITFMLDAIIFQKTFLNKNLDKVSVKFHRLIVANIS